MPIDGYAPCPGGLGKKVKFCCPDLIQDLAKIERMREGEQTTACLDLVERLDAKHPGRACLLAAKAELLRELGRKDEADVAVRGLLEKSGPDNPVALAEAAILACQNGETLQAARLFHEALSVLELEEPWPESVFVALPNVAVLLLNSGYWMAARSHLSLQLAFNREDRSVLEILSSLNQSPGLPLLLKQPFALPDCQDNVPWKAEFNQAMKLAKHAHWLAAADKLSAMAERGINSPLLWRNLANLRGRIAEEAAASEAYAKLAGCDIPLNDAIEAAALSQLLHPDIDALDTLRITYPVVDLEHFHEVMLSDSRCEAVKQLPPGDENQPPPKAGFSLLDRPRPATGVGLTLEALPQVLGSVMLYGKQTDREARLELYCWRPERRQPAHTFLTQLGFGMLGPPDAGEAVDSTAIDAAILEIDYQFPTDTPVDTRYNLSQAVRKRAILTEWPNTPRPSLGGQTPAQAARSGGRIAALAAVMVLEQHCDSARLEFDFDALRAQLGLPLPEPIAAVESEVSTIIAARLSRLVMSHLTDEQLQSLVPLGRVLAAYTASKRACRELLARLGDKEPLQRAQLLAVVAGQSSDTRESLKLVDQARELAVSARHSSGEFDLIELKLRMARGEIEQFNGLLEHLMSEHMNEPHVRQEVTQMLVQLGLIRPDGTPVRRPEAANLAAPPAEEAGKLWTPESARGSGEKKSFWVPD